MELLYMTPKAMKFGVVRIKTKPKDTSTPLSCASMQDTGNFVLRDKDGKLVWESFEEPTDTLLPGQNFSKLQPVSLQARHSNTSFSYVNFNLSWQNDGNLVLYYSQKSRNQQPYAYWAAGTYSRGSQLVFDKLGRIYITDDTAVIYDVASDVSGSKEYYYMARIDSDVVFRLYSYRKALTTDSCLSGWNELKTIPDDICLTVIGENENFFCGLNSYCISINGKPQCRCPDHYSSFVQPNDPNNLTSCRPDFPPPSCLVDEWEGNQDLVDFEERENLNWPFSDYELESGDFDKDTCREKCREDCFCAAAVYNKNGGTGQCWKKKYPLSNGRYSTKAENGTIVFLKFRKLDSYIPRRLVGRRIFLFPRILHS